jgi:uncharacterized protein (TIGR04222 family)
MNTQLEIMNSQNMDLHQRIQAFSLDQPGAQLSFSKRLARDNGWSLAYAQRVIEEYKKFTFLAVAAGHSVTPSDQVDQAWHLHLSYTRSYWQEFCLNVLQTSLHHDPTAGGSSEQSKFNDWYSRTLESYREFFGEIPPTDIWPNPKDRFDRDLHFVRVNTDQNWLVPKLWLRHQQALRLLFLLIVAIAVPGYLVVGSIPNPLNFNGSEFLVFYFLLSVVVLFVADRLRSYLRLPDGETPIILEPYEAAYLAGRKHRVVDTAITSLAQKGHVAIEKTGRILIIQKSAKELSNPVEQAVVDAITVDGRISSIRRATNQPIETIRERLSQINLLVSPNQSTKAQRYPAVLIAFLFGLGILKISVGISREKPVKYLLIMCFIIAAIGFTFWIIPSHRSRYGDRVLQNLRTHVSSTVDSNVYPQALFAVALLGVTVLPNDIFADLKEILAVVSTDDNDSGGCGGSGDSGCGGCGG